jgi:Cu2+-exporting ATPase
MMTGDSQQVAADVSQKLSIDDFFAQFSPSQKAEKIKLLKEKGLRVAMVGDGVNDAPALVTADVGIAIGAGTDVAVESADIILVKNDPQDVAKVAVLSQKTYSKMVQNLWWAAGYNIVALPLAAGVLAGFGVVIDPAVGAILMSLSTVIVAVNSQTLRRYDPTKNSA